MSKGARQALRKLQSMHGLSEVKSQVEEMVFFAQFESRRRQFGLKNNVQSFHMIFTGNPGTGKTTTARLIGEAFAEIGLLQSTKPEVPFIEISHVDISGRHVGESEKNLQKKFKEAEGGVLFVDEAYSLVGRAEHNVDAKVMATLVQCIENLRDKVLVILAGYPEEMEELMGFNPGLASRFPNTINFPDYSVNDLLQISKKMLDEQGFAATGDYYTALAQVLWIEKSKPRFGNARTLRNIIESSIRKHAVAVAKTESISLDDLTILNVNSMEVNSTYAGNIEKLALQKIMTETQQRLFELEIKELAARH